MGSDRKLRHWPKFTIYGRTNPRSVKFIISRYLSIYFILYKILGEFKESLYCSLAGLLSNKYMIYKHVNRLRHFKTLNQTSANKNK